jgi:hypothetical protein
MAAIFTTPSTAKSLKVLVPLPENVVKPGKLTLDVDVNDVPEIEKFPLMETGMDATAAAVPLNVKSPNTLMLPAFNVFVPLPDKVRF